ncbi:MAG: flavodoxin family protein [Promethearchaeati archaeon]
MNTLVVYYTRTGNTKKMAEEIAAKLDAELDEIIDKTKRSGFVRWFYSGYQAVREKLTEIEDMEKDPSNYGLIILGTPTWAGKMTPALRTYITRYKDQLNKVAILITSSGKKGDPLIESISEFCGKDPIATAHIIQKEIEEDKYQEKIDQFVQEIKNKSQ